MFQVDLDKESMEWVLGMGVVCFFNRVVFLEMQIELDSSVKKMLRVSARSYSFMPGIYTLFLSQWQVEASDG